MIVIATFIEPSKESRKITVNGSRAIIGRDTKADIHLDHSSISREHAKIKILEGKSHFTIEDLDSANGTFVDGVRINERTIVYPDQQLETGPFKFSLCHMPDIENPGSKSGGNPEHDAFNEERIILEAVRDLPHILPHDRNQTNESDTSFSAEAEKALYRKIIELLPTQTKATRAEFLTQKALTLSLGLGPLEGWLKDPDISEIMINGTESVYVERNGILGKFQTPFKDEQSILRIIERILSPLGRRIDDKSPYVDGRLPDGSRINVIIPPASLIGPVVTIRKFPEDRLDIAKLVKLRTVSQDAAQFLKDAVVNKRNILISGGTGSGKTTLLNCLAAFIPPSERVITIEDAAELNLGQEHIIRLETRPPNIEGDNEITTRDLLKNSLRMRPDRIIVGECRGAETLDMLQAMNTGHEGSMTTCHANSPRDALKRIEMMALMAGIDLPLKVLREQVASGINIIIQINRMPGGQRAITSIVEIDGFDTEQILTQTLFEYESQSSVLERTGIQASFLSCNDNDQPAGFPQLEVK